MKKLLGIQIVCMAMLCTHANATNYYFSSTSGDDSRSTSQAKSSSTPWKTISKLNSFFASLLPGDSVLFKRGDVFYGEIIIGRSGTSSQQITLGAYGSGAKPVITGFTTITSWKSSGSGIYESVVSSATSPINMVVKNDVFQPLGRWPKATATNSGYLMYQSLSGVVSITTNALSGALNYVGGELVVRANHYNLNRGIINSQSSSTIGYTIIPGGAINSPQTGYGFFFQNHAKTLTTFGEWCYESSSKKLKMYFGSNSPSSSTVKASVLANNVTLTSKSYINFVNLAFTGSNAKALNIVGSNNIQITGCDISFCGINGISANNNTCNNVTVTSCNLSNINNNGIYASSAQYWKIRYCNLTNIAAVAGMGQSGDQQYFGMSYIGPNCLIEYNNLNNIGYTAIHYVDGPATIQYNLVNNFCLVKDDGGGIYTFKNTSSSVKTVKSNIVINGVGAPNGTPSFLGGGAIGLYADGGVTNVQFLNNSVANCQQLGILYNNSNGAVVSGNTVYNCGTPYNGNLDGGGGQIQFTHWSGWQSVRTNVLTNNIFVAKLAIGQATARFVTPDNDLNQFFSSASNNYYARPMSDNATIFNRVSSPAWLTVAQWQSVTGKESGIKKSPKTITSVNSLRFEYNATSTNKVVSLGAAYVDIKGTSYPSSITLAPYSSAVLILASGAVNARAANATVEEATTDLALKPAFTVYPNPVRSDFVLQMNNQHRGKVEIEIINQAGIVQKRYQYTKDKQLEQINLSAPELPTGVYFIRVQMGSLSDRKKLLKL